VHFPVKQKIPIEGRNWQALEICSGEAVCCRGAKPITTTIFYEIGIGTVWGFFLGINWIMVKLSILKAVRVLKRAPEAFTQALKVSAEIAEVRGLKSGGNGNFLQLPFPIPWRLKILKRFAEKVPGSEQDGIPIGFKIAASHIEKDIHSPLDVGVDYIILDGPWWRKSSAPTNLSVTILNGALTIPALARARKFLDKVVANHVTLIITGRLRVAEDFAKA